MSLGRNAFLAGLVTMLPSYFGFLAAEYAIVGLVPREEQSWVYLLRVAAFGIIAIAIARKNLGRGHQSRTRLL